MSREHKEVNDLMQEHMGASKGARRRDSRGRFTLKERVTGRVIANKVRGYIEQSGCVFTLLVLMTIGFGTFLSAFTWLF